MCFYGYNKFNCYNLILLQNYCRLYLCTGKQPEALKYAPEAYFFNLKKGWQLTNNAVIFTSPLFVN